MPADWLNQAMGPLGALVLTLAGLLWVVRQWRADVKTLAEKLETEHEARLEDARANTQAMLELNDRAHATVRDLADIADRLQRSSLRPPPTTGPRPPG
jgi:hypothetical protein